MSAERFSPKRDAMTYRQHFAAAWARFINENFDSPEHAAMCFGVDGKTARNWSNGDHAPAGFAVGLAYARWPEQASATLRSVGR